jgi:hypothetical protein
MFYDSTSIAHPTDFMHQIGQALSGSRIPELNLYDLSLFQMLPLILAMANHPTLTKLALGSWCKGSAMALRN